MLTCQEMIFDIPYLTARKWFTIYVTVLETKQFHHTAWKFALGPFGCSVRVFMVKPVTSQVCTIRFLKAQWVMYM